MLVAVRINIRYCIVTICGISQQAAGNEAQGYNTQNIELYNNKNSSCHCTLRIFITRYVVNVAFHELLISSSTPLLPMPYQLIKIDRPLMCHHHLQER